MLIVAFLVSTASPCEANLFSPRIRVGEATLGNDLRSSHQTIRQHGNSYWRWAFNSAGSMIAVPLFGGASSTYR
jgi:hypothetical protein